LKNVTHRFICWTYECSDGVQFPADLKLRARVSKVLLCVSEKEDELAVRRSGVMSHLRQIN